MTVFSFSFMAAMELLIVLVRDGGLKKGSKLFNDTQQKLH